MRKFNHRETFLLAALLSIIIRHGLIYTNEQLYVPYVIWIALLWPILILLILLPGILVDLLSVDPNRAQAKIAGALAALAHPQLPFRVAADQQQEMYAKGFWSPNLFALQTFIFLSIVIWFFWLTWASGLSVAGLRVCQWWRRRRGTIKTP